MTFKVKKTNTGVFLFAGLVLSISTSLMARDISREQDAASDARSAYNRAKHNYTSVTQKIDAQEQRVASEQAKLNTLKTEQADTQKILDIRESDLQRKVDQLNAVWDERNR